MIFTQCTFANGHRPQKRSFGLHELALHPVKVAQVILHFGKGWILFSKFLFVHRRRLLQERFHLVQLAHLYVQQAELVH